MYIEFGLPNGAGGLAPAIANGELRKDIREWADKHRVTGYTLHNTLRDYRHYVRLEFQTPADYSLFALTWRGRSFMGPTYK